MSSSLGEGGERGMRLGSPSVTLSTCDPAHPVLLHQPRGRGDSMTWEGSRFHKQNLSDELLPRMTGGSPSVAPRMSHLNVGHANTSSKSMDGLNSGAGGLLSDHPAFARTRQYRSMSNEDMKPEMLPTKRMPGEPTNYMEAAAAALKTGKGSSIIDNLMKEYRSGNLYARQPADLLLPSAKEDPSHHHPTIDKSDLVLHRENSAPQLTGSLRERHMQSPPDYPGHSRFGPNFDVTPTGTPRASSPVSMMSDMDFPTARSSRSIFGSRDKTSSVFADFDSGFSSRSSRARIPSSPLSTSSASSMMSDFDMRMPPPEYPGFKRSPWQSHSGREHRTRKEGATVDHSRASSFGSYQHSLKRLSSETSYDSSRGSSTSSTSPLSTDAPSSQHPSPPAPHPSPASHTSHHTPSSPSHSHSHPQTPLHPHHQAGGGPGGLYETDHEVIANRATHMVEMLSDENSALRHELETYYQKVAKLQKFEQEIHKVQMEHEKLIESTHKREHLEKLVRTKLEVEVKKIKERNRDLTVHVESHSRGASSKGGARDEGATDSDLQEELSRKESSLFQAQMKCKDFEETNMQLMDELKEQRKHVDMLDAALSKAQADVAKLQEECARRQVYVDKVGSLQRLVTSLQAAHQKREKLENRLRQKLEKEIEKLSGKEHAANQDEGVSELEDATSETLAGLLSQKEHTILKLEAEVSKWEHKYLEECAIRQCHVDVPTSSRLESVGEQEAQTDRGQGEAPSLRDKTRIQDLETRLAALSIEVQKRDMIIQALQNQFLEHGSYMGGLPSSSHSSTERLPPRGVSPQGSFQHLRRGSVDSSLPPSSGNLAGSGSPTTSTSSLQNLAASSRSPASSSLQNLQQPSPASSTASLPQQQVQGQHPAPAMSAASSTSSSSTAHSLPLHHPYHQHPHPHHHHHHQQQFPSPASSSQNLSMTGPRSSPATSQQNLHHITVSSSSGGMMGGRSPGGSQQSLGGASTMMQLPPFPSSQGSLGSGLGSQERLMGFSDSYTSLSTSGLSMTGTDGGSEMDLARERSVLDEKLKQLDLEIAQQDKILGAIWKS